MKKPNDIAEAMISLMKNEGKNYNQMLNLVRILSRELKKHDAELNH